MDISILYAIGSMFFFGIGVFFYKLGSEKISTGLGISIFIITHLIPITLFALSEKMEMNTSAVKYLILGGVAAGVAQVFFFSALKAGKVNTVVPIRNLAVLITVILAMLFLGESLTARKLLGIGAAIFAIYLLSV